MRNGVFGLRAEARPQRRPPLEASEYILRRFPGRRARSGATARSAEVETWRGFDLDLQGDGPLLCLLAVVSAC